MQYKKLGKTDLNVSSICFGCWQLSPRFWGEVEIKPWENAITEALDQGINFIDNANSYGNGYAEECLGNFLKKNKLRDKFVLATKFFWNFQTGTFYPDTRYDYIINECENSLKRLKTDHIDLYQLHSWDPLTQPEEVEKALKKLRKDGKIRWFGVSNLNADQMRMYLRYSDIECLQPHYNMLFRDVEDHELPLCLEHKIGVIPYSPLYRGLLTGKYRKNHKFKDSRANNPYFQKESYNRILEALKKIKPIAEKHDLSLAQFAIRWILTHPAITSAIVGIKTPDHITSIVKAADDILPQEDWHDSANIIKSAKNDIDKQ